VGNPPPLLGLSARDQGDLLNAYVELYLREEIQLEGIVRNLGGFTRFLDFTTKDAEQHFCRSMGT